MNMFILDNEAGIRLAFFFSIFLVMSTWELAAPKRALTVSKPGRWAVNLAITALNTLALRVLFPLQAVGFALIAREKGWGLLNIVSASEWQATAVSVAVLDLVIYFQHRFFHRIPLFWRLHKMHHVDLDIDVTTGARFHPVEIMASMLIKMTVVLLLGAPAAGVVAFEVLLNGTSMFNHSNVRMPERADRLLRLFVVTPDMHRVHHSVVPRETNSNFGFNMPWWDRLFGTYKPRPDAGHQGMTIGLPQYREAKQLTFPRLLAMPFRK